MWVTPKLGTTGWEALIRHDDYLPNDAIHSQKQKRDIDGIAYWVPNLGGKYLGWRPWHYEGARKIRKATTAVGGISSLLPPLPAGKPRCLSLTSC